MVLAAFNLITVLQSASAIELLVLFALAATSVYSWALIALKWRQLRRGQRGSAEFIETFWNASSFEKLFESSKSLDHAPVARVFRAGYEELSKVANTSTSISAVRSGMSGIENVQRALNRASLSELTELEAHVAFLGTVGSTAPFVGLFGTVMGILGAFNEIAARGNATITTVAGPIGNALLATAAGLFAAIPAVIAYNSFVTRIKVIDADLSTFSSDFLNVVKRHVLK